MAFTARVVEKENNFHLHIVLYSKILFFSEKNVFNVQNLFTLFPRALNFFVKIRIA